MKKGSQILLGLVIASSILLIAAVPDWIQYNERVVGENSPYFTDVVNRPAKQIWGNFTSQHDVNGGHKASIFPTAIPTIAFPTPLPTATPVTIPTPLPTATPIPLSLLQSEHVITASMQDYTSLSTTDGNCQGRLQVSSTGGYYYIDSPVPAHCHTYRIVTLANGMILVGRVFYDAENTYLIVESISYIELVYAPTANRWIVTAARGTITAYTSPPPPPQQ